MDDARVGSAIRAVRVRRGWRQQDVATRAGVSRGLVSLVERGHLDRTRLDSLRRMASVLDIRIDVIPRWRGGELDRLLNARHSALHEAVAAYFASLPGWQILPEVSFSIYGERGVMDVLAFHASSGCLLVIELKSAVIDINDLMGNLDRKRRLAAQVAAERGWHARSISTWIIVGRGRTNQRRLGAHRTVLRTAYPDSGRAVRSWLLGPSGTIAALSTWPDDAINSAVTTWRHRPSGHRSVSVPRGRDVAPHSIPDGAKRKPGSREAR